MKKILNFLKESIQQVWLYRFITQPLQHKVGWIILIAMIGSGSYYGPIYYDKFMVMYEEANNGEDDDEDDVQGITFTQVDTHLYTLTGTIKEDDCEKIVPLLPQAFTVILESPGGNLAEGSCIAAHFKLRNVVTVVRNTPVLNDEGKVIYDPGVSTRNDYIKQGMSPEDLDDLRESQGYPKVVCASACGVIFLGGAKRYLVGEVMFGIHGPATPEESLKTMNRRQLETTSYRTASSILRLLEQLGVHESIRLLFIQIPSHSMYWLHPNDFDARPGLITIATNYKNFFGFENSDLEGGLR